MKAPTPKRERPFAQVRKDLGLDLNRAAARLRVNPHYLRTLELGRAPLSYALAQRMAGAYETSIQALTQPPKGAGGTGEEGREVSGNTSRPVLSEELVMRVTGWHSGTYGIRVGRANAHAHFAREWTNIEVELDRATHRFALSSTFWTTCPEFRGAAITRWLTRRNLAPWPKGSPPELELVPLGGNRFRLQESSQMALALPAVDR